VDKTVISKDTLVPLSVFGLVLICVASIMLWMTKVWATGERTEARLSAVEIRVDTETKSIRSEVKEQASNQIEIMKQLAKIEGMIQSNNKK
jgi:hypothetical protein